MGDQTPEPSPEAVAAAATWLHELYEAHRKFEAAYADDTGDREVPALPPWDDLTAEQKELWREHAGEAFAPLTHALLHVAGLYP